MLDQEALERTPRMAGVHYYQMSDRRGYLVLDCPHCGEKMKVQQRPGKQRGRGAEHDEWERLTARVRTLYSRLFRWLGNRLPVEDPQSMFECWEELLGYRFERLQVHLQPLLCDSLCWKNYGLAWQLDHIRPHVLFRPAGGQNVLECVRRSFAVENLRPLAVRDNLARNIGSKRWDGSK